MPESGTEDARRICSRARVAKDSRRVSEPAERTASAWSTHRKSFCTRRPLSLLWPSRSRSLPNHGQGAPEARLPCRSGGNAAPFLSDTGLRGRVLWRTRELRAGGSQREGFLQGAPREPHGLPLLRRRRERHPTRSMAGRAERRLPSHPHTGAEWPVCMRDPQPSRRLLSGRGGPGRTRGATAGHDPRWRRPGEPGRSSRLLLLSRAGTDRFRSQSPGVPAPPGRQTTCCSSGAGCMGRPSPHPVLNRVAAGDRMERGVSSRAVACHLSIVEVDRSDDQSAPGRSFDIRKASSGHRRRRSDRSRDRAMKESALPRRGSVSARSVHGRAGRAVRRPARGRPP